MYGRQIEVNKEEEEQKLIDSNKERLKQIDDEKLRLKNNRTHNIEVMTALTGHFEEYEQKENCDPDVMQNIHALLENAKKALKQERLDSRKDLEIEAEKNSLKSAWELINHQNNQEYVNDLFDKVMVLEAAREQNTAPESPDIFCMSPLTLGWTLGVGIPFIISAAGAYGCATSLYYNNGVSEGAAIGGGVGLFALFGAVTGWISSCILIRDSNGFKSMFVFEEDQKNWVTTKNNYDKNMFNHETSVALVKNLGLLAKKVAKNIPNQKELREVAVETNSTVARPNK